MAGKKKLPTALARRAAEKAEAAHQRNLADARAVIAEIKRKQAQISDAFFDIGELLLRLKKANAAKSLGLASFQDLVERELRMSITRADWLVAVVSRVRRDDALRWGEDKTMALLELTNATRPTTRRRCSPPRLTGSRPRGAAVATPAGDSHRYLTHDVPCWAGSALRTHAHPRVRAHDSQKRPRPCAHRSWP